MPRPSLAPPDAAPLREALRGIRFLLRRGGATVADTITLEALPDPAADVARRVLREVEGIARTVDEAASAAAKTVLGGYGNPSDTLDRLIGQSDAAAEFGRAIYVALDAVLQRMKAADAFISEMAARTCFAHWRHEHPEGEPPDWAAELTLRLLDARVIRGAVPDRQNPAGLRDVEAVALFAVLLWLQSDRSQDENEEVLAAAADMAQARSDEVAAAVRSRDTLRIAALYRKYVDHV